jgi:hypothetical protein
LKQLQSRDPDLIVYCNTSGYYSGTMAMNNAYHTAAPLGFIPPPSILFHITTPDGKFSWNVARRPFKRTIFCEAHSTEDEPQWRFLNDETTDDGRLKLQHRSTGLVITHPASIWQPRLGDDLAESGDRSDRQWLTIEPAGGGRHKFRIRFCQSRALLSYLPGQPLQTFPGSEGKPSEVPKLPKLQLTREAHQQDNFVRGPLIGYFGIEVEPVQLISIQYELDKGELLASDKLTGGTQLCSNDTDLTLKQSCKITENTQNSSVWRNDFGLKFQASVKTDVSIPQLYNQTFILHHEQTRAISWGETLTETTSWEQTTEITIGPHRSLMVSYSVERQRLRVPFIASWRIDRNGETFRTHGSYEGMSYLNLETKMNDTAGTT